MIASEHTQSLADFRAKASEIIDRLNQTGEPEILTVDGEPRAVLLSPALYDELARESELSRDVAAIHKAMREFDEGQGRPAEEFFNELRAELLAMKAAQDSTRKTA